MMDYVSPKFLWKEIYGQATISNSMLFPPKLSAEELEALHARRRKEWDENLEAGLVPAEWEYLNEDGDESGWKLVEKYEEWHDCTWIRPDLWNMYLFVGHLAEAIDEEIRKGAGR